MALIYFFLLGDPNKGLKVETPWISAESPQFNYLSLSGQESPPKMDYDYEMKTRAIRWSNYFDKICSRFNQSGLSDLPPLTSSDIEAQFFSKKLPKTEL